MRSHNILQCLLLLGALGTNAQDATDSGSSSSSTSSKPDQLILTGGAKTSGVTEEQTPTGSYISYSSTVTLQKTTTVPVSTVPVVSTVTTGSSTYVTTVGSTTLFAAEALPVSNLSDTGSSSTTSSMILLRGSSTALPTNTIPSNSTSNSTSTSTSSSPLPTNTTPCNNYPAFCDRQYSNITEVSAHNSPFSIPNNAASNQALSVTQQLDDGIRLLQGQMHIVNGTPHFCHTSCDILDAGPITNYLTQVASWVSSHPYDVVTILLENGDYVPVTTYVPFLESTGLVRYAYVPPKVPMSKEDWPTLGNMILSGKRVVFFMDYNADQTAVPWILDEFSHVWETPFDPTDRSFPCDVQRPPNLAPQDARQRMYLTNHNLNYDIQLLGNSLLVPVIPLLNVTNNVTGFGSLGASVITCVDQWGVPPRFLNVDYYNAGNGSVFEVAANWSGVVYNRTCCGMAKSAGVLSIESSLVSTIIAAIGTGLLMIMI
ncbi:tat pathway signal sequence [Xylogone sp. PMI_703]|nr:tat pathway signal sequence [Xylogone sp. PMI_703]